MPPAQSPQAVADGPQPQQGPQPSPHPGGAEHSAVWIREDGPLEGVFVTERRCHLGRPGTYGHEARGASGERSFKRAQLRHAFTRKQSTIVTHEDDHQGNLVEVIAQRREAAVAVAQGRVQERVRHHWNCSGPNTVSELLPP